MIRDATAIVRRIACLYRRIAAPVFYIHFVTADPAPTARRRFLLGVVWHT
jgi:hypothetical protein